MRSLPVEKYDLVLNDFECITALACARKKIPSVNFGHQASFLSDKTPRPAQKNAVGEWILKNYAKATRYVGLHFESYDHFILSPVIKDEVRRTEPSDKGHITVYLPSYCDHVLLRFLKPHREFRFEVFSWEVNQVVKHDHIEFIPVGKNRFNQSLVSCTGIITGAGFETPAEALYLKKKILAMPIKGQYEQCCNAAALKKIGVRTIEKLDDNFTEIFLSWINDPMIPSVTFQHSTQTIVDFVMKPNSDVMLEDGYDDVIM